MENNYKPLLPNKKIKTFRVSDDTNSHNERRIYELFSNLKQQRFQLWINSPLKSRTLNDRGKYVGKYIYNDLDNVILKGAYIEEFIENIIRMMESYGYSINNNKLFRDTIASYIYKLSN